MSHTRLVVFVLAASTVAVAGCGGSKTTSSQSKASVPAEQSAQTQQSSTQTESSTSTESATAGKPLAHTALVAKADAICRHLNMQAATISIKSPQDIARTAPQLAIYYRTALTDLRKLTPPAAIAGDWKAIVADVQTLANEIVTVGKYAADNDPASMTRVDKNVTNVQRHRFAIAKRDGFKDCAEL
jgi:hypothetical protein